MITVTGRLVDESGTPLPDLIIEAQGDWLLTTKRLAGSKSDSQGRFKLEIKEIQEIPELPLQFRLRVFDITKRPVREDQELNGKVKIQDLGDITLQSGDVNGMLVTDLTGQAHLVSEGNAIKLLVDGEEAFGRIADDLRNATRSINVTQLFFSVPDKYHHDNDAIDPVTKLPKEKAKLIFKFKEPPIQPIDPLEPNSPPDHPRTGDDRPERLILSAAHANTDLEVRILLNEPALGWPEGILWLTVLTPLALGLGVGGASFLIGLIGISLPALPFIVILTLAAWIVEAIAIPRILKNQTDVDEVTAYYDAAITDAAPAHPSITVRGFRQPAPNNGVLHCKMVIVDNKRAVVVGSPFTQRYFDGPAHRIDEPRRGSNTADIVHDVSAAVVGPAVRDLHDTFRLFWNEDLPLNSSQRVMGINAPAPEIGGEDGLATVQVVRTLSGGRFADLNHRSEKGILEAYLRAFAFARSYIYLETQYFTDSVITEALVEVLQQRKDLELILMLNIKPDVVFYPRRQAGRVEQLRAAGKDRVGVFTRWSYKGNVPINARPWIAPVYLHSKVGIVDDRWATIGSANLDGLSLDYNLLLSPLVFGETTAAEVNLSIIPPHDAVSPVADLLRRRLFAEHLGLVGTDGKPNPEDEVLKAKPTGGWLPGLWIPRAKEALEHVKEGRPVNKSGFVLEYPPDAKSLTTARKHLAALGVNVKKINESVVRPIRATRGFEFSTGKWSKTPELEDIEL